MKIKDVMFFCLIVVLISFFSGCTENNSDNSSPVALINAEDKGFTNQALYFDSSNSYDSKGEIVSYLWDFGDWNSKEVEEKGVFYKYQKTGNYSVNLTVTDKEGNTDFETVYINISSNDLDNNKVPDNWGNAPNFVFNSLDDENYRLSDFFGKVVLLDLMGVDCQFCVYQMPVLKYVSENYSRFDLAIISIDVYLYETEEYLQSFIDAFKEELDIGLDWIFCMDSNGDISKDYIGVNEGVPKLVLIDQNGNIYYEFMGYTQYSEIKNKLNEIV